MFEEARSLAVMMKMRNLSQSETAKMLGVSQSYVANKLRLLKLDDEMQKKILAERLTERHARALLRLKDSKTRKTVLDRVCNEKLSVQRTEAVVDFYHIPETADSLSRADGLSSIYMFLDSLASSLLALSSTGVQVGKKISYEEDRIYVTISIKEA